MTISNVCFCRDQHGQFGLVRAYQHGQLLVRFDDGERWVQPKDLTFL